MANEVNETVVDQHVQEELEETEPTGDLKVALKQEREKRREAQKEAKAAKEAVAKFQPLAEEYSQLLPYLPHLLSAADTGRRAAASTTTPQDDPEAVEYAQIMGYETEDGKPDVAKARRAIDFHDKRTGAKVNKAIAPAAAQSASVVAAQIRERAYKAVDENGRLYASKAAIDKVFSEIPPEQLANPDTAVAALIMARGLGGPGPENSEPLYTESTGRSRAKKVAVSDMGKSIAAMRGRSEADWAKLQDEPQETGWDLE